MEFKGHSGDLEASLARALDDFDHYRELDQVPLLHSDDGSAPVSMRTVKRRLEAAGLSEQDESYAHPNELRSAIDKWIALDDAYAVGTIEEASEALHDNLETFMTNRTLVLGGRALRPEAEEKRKEHAIDSRSCLSHIAYSKTVAGDCSHLHSGSTCCWFWV
jgi:hypothetical protein